MNDRAGRVLRFPRPSRVEGYLSARLGPPVIEPTVVRDILAEYGLQPDGGARNLRLGRRSRNVALATTDGPKVIKLYRPQWRPATVDYCHSILLRLEESSFPAPRLARTQTGKTWTSGDDGIFGVFDFVAGKNYSLNFLRRGDRLWLTVAAGETLARLHRKLEGFVPAGWHHLGFAATGARRRDVAWHAAKLEELETRSARLTDPDAKTQASALIARAPHLLDEIRSLDASLTGASFPKFVIHGDYGLHNLLFQADGLAVPVDFELSRLDWRVNDLISALVKYRYKGGNYDLESMDTFVRAYASVFPLTADERELLPEAWRLYKLHAAAQYWNSYFETDGPVRKLHSAVDSIGQAEWVLQNPEVIARLSRAAEEGLEGRDAGRSSQTNRRRNGREDPRSDRELKVMQVTPNLEIGGAQQTVQTLTKYLPRTGCPSVVCAFGGGPLAGELTRHGIEIEFLPARRHSALALPLFLLEMARRRRDLLDLVKKHRIDVLQTQGLGTLDFLVMTLRRRRKIQVWWTIQNASFMVREEDLQSYRWLLGTKRWAHRLLYRLGARIVDGVVAVSDETLRSFQDVAGDAGGKLTVVCNAVDVELYPARVDRERLRAQLGFTPDDHLMTMVGTFKRQKGHRYLVDAAVSVAPIFSNLHILLVGDGELAVDIDAQVEAAGLRDRIHFLGTRRDVAELLAASDSFVLPSLWEGLPVALLEAMASALPVIATSVSGTSQVMVPGMTGWLVPPAEPGALADAMRELLSDRDRAAAMAAAARERVASRFSARAQAERLSAHFREARS